MHLSDKALLVHLSVSQWTARKLDRKASDEVAKNNGATANAGNFHKSLLPTCNELEVLKTATSTIRKRFYQNTLPWGIEGTFILPSANYLPFTSQYRKDKAAWEGLRDAFFGAYTQAHQDARRLLSGLYKATDYPTLADLKLKFGMDMAVLPVPMAGDFRVELSDEHVDSLTADIEKRVAASSQAAMDDVWQRLYDKVAWLSERLSDPDRNFHDSAYTDAADLCGLLRRLNFTDDPNLEQMRAEAENKLFKLHPHVVRNDPEVRRDNAASAKEIMNKMAVFMGAAS
jgi:hypothetical protein